MAAMMPGLEARERYKTPWLDAQVPQPPAQHSYRFSRDWDYRGPQLCAGARIEPGHTPPVKE
jgi:hypothetical protein